MSNHVITLQISKKELKVKELMNWEQVDEGRTKLGELLDVAKKIAAGEADNAEVTMKLFNKTKEQDAIMAKTLLANTELTQKELNKFKYLDALLAYNELFELSTTVPKNLNKPSISESDSPQQ